jgi:ABC-type multidrug transport system fused ATPase/permease subunit
MGSDSSSLRQVLGTVPQAPVLFNDTVMANIQYANRMASEDQVFEACTAACIHDKILGFSDGEWSGFAASFGLLTASRLSDASWGARSVSTS